MQSIPQFVKKEIGQYIKPKTPFQTIDKILVYANNINLENDQIKIFAASGIQIQIFQNNGRIILQLFVFRRLLNEPSLELEYNIDYPANNFKTEVLFFIRFVLLNYRIFRLDDFGNDYVIIIQNAYQGIENNKLHALNLKRNLDHYQPSAKLKRMIDILKLVRPITNRAYDI